MTATNDIMAGWKQGDPEIHFNKGDKLRLGAVHNSAGSGLDYDAQHVIASESGVSGGWDVYDAIANGGREISFYGYSVIEKIS